MSVGPLVPAVAGRWVCREHTCSRCQIPPSTWRARPAAPAPCALRRGAHHTVPANPESLTGCRGAFK